MPDRKNAVSGSPDGRPFSTVADSWVIESPDAEGATLVYLFSTPVPCVALSFSDWDRRLGDDTIVLAIEAFGKTPGGYLASPAPGPALRAAAVVWSHTSRRGPSQDQRASGGWVTLDALAPRGAARGSFALSFGGRTISGEFAAPFCEAGHEP